MTSNSNNNQPAPEEKKEEKKPLKFLFVSYEGLIGDLAWQVKKEGSEVKYYIRDKSEKDICDGFVDKCDDWKEFKDWADVICYHKDTRVLTRRGWVYFYELNEDDFVATLSREGYLEWQKPIKFIKKYFSGELISYKSEQICFAVTPKHNMYVRYRKRDRWDFSLVPIEEIYGKTHIEFKKDCKWIGNRIESIIIPAYIVKFECGKPKILREMIFEEKRYDAKLFMAFLGFYIAEGCVKFRNKRTNPTSVCIGQRKGEILNEFKEILEKLHIKYSVSKRKNNFYEIIINDCQLASYLLQFGHGAENKHIPDFFKELSVDLLVELYEWFKKGDGSSKYVCTSSRQLVDDLVEIGLKVNVILRILKKPPLRMKTGYLCREHYVLIENRKKITPLIRDKKLWKKIPYNDFVYCVEVPNHIIYVNYKDAMMWCGNCFDDIGFGQIADELRKNGKLVVGGTPFTDRLEDDREFGQDELKKAGVNTLPHWDFVGFDDAIEFVKKNPERYVIKPSGRAQNEKELTFVGQEEDGNDVLNVLEHYKKNWSKKMSLQLQKFVQGVEVAVGAFFNGKEFVQPIFINFEHKKLFPGGLGPNCGEMGCYDDQTEVLTREGWKLFKELSYGDEICTLNPSSFAVEYQTPSAIVEYEHHKKMVDISNRAVSLTVTPDHNMFGMEGETYRTGGDRWRFVKARELTTKFVVPRTGKWEGIDEEYFCLPEYIYSRGTGHSCVVQLQEIKIKMDFWLEFLGFYLSEGYSSGKHVTIAQMKEKTRVEALEIIKRLPFKAVSCKDGLVIYNSQLATYLKQFGKAPQKWIPRYVKDASPRQIKLFLDAFALGDAYHYKNGYRVFYTSSKRLADDIQELLLKIGRVGLIKARKPRKGRIGDRVITSENLQYEVIERVQKTVSWLDARDRREIPYSGKVYCAEVPNHIMYVRKSGKPVFCGNTLGLWAPPNKLFNETLLKMKPVLEASGYSGYFDLNCIVNSRGIFPLEFTARPGYPTISLQIEGVTSSWSEFLRSLATGEATELKTKKGFQVCVVVAVPPFPFTDPNSFKKYSEDATILFKKPNLDGVHLGDVKLVEDDWRLAGQSGYALIVTGSGTTVDDARKQVYSRVRNIMIPNMFYRTDIGEQWPVSSDMLYTWGYLY